MIDRGLGRCRRGTVASLAVGLTLSLGLGLAGCEDGSAEPPDSGLPSESKTSPSDSAPTEDPTPTEPAGPTPPTIPQAATKAGKEGAKAFVRFYIELENYAKDTGNVEPLEQYSHPQCGGCGDYIKFYREWYARGGWFKDGDRTIMSFDRVVRTVPPNDMYVRVSGVHKAGDYRERRNAPIERARQERYTFVIWLLRDSRGWRISGLDNV